MALTSDLTRKAAGMEHCESDRECSVWRSRVATIQQALDADREKVAQLSEENNNLVVELAELRETVTDLKCSFHGRLSTAQTDLTQLQALVRAYFKARSGNDQNEYVQAYAALKATLDATPTATPTHNGGA